MTELLLTAGPLQRVLEVGTGSGYQTAILAQLVGRVYSVERIKPLQNKARQRLRTLRLNNVQLLHSDGGMGWEQHAPYDGIIVAAAASVIPEKLLQQLAPGGQLVIPIGPPGLQELMLVARKDDHFEQSSLGAVSFVPLVAGN